jgi:hypothetical protein
LRLAHLSSRPAVTRRLRAADPESARAGHLEDERMTVVRQRGNADCGVAALANLTGQPYEDVYVEAARVDTKHRGKNGLWNYQMRAIAARLGVTLTSTRTYDLDEDAGILRVRWTGAKAVTSPGGHFIAVRDGIAFCPASPAPLAWRHYLEINAGRACTLLRETA